MLTMCAFQMFVLLLLLLLLLLCKMLNNGCNDFLFGVHCVEEGDRIPPLQSYGQALKHENCFSGVLGDDCGASANLLD